MCGIFAIVDHPDAARLTALGLAALQHRGQESAGLAVAHQGRLQVERQVGSVAHVLQPHVLQQLLGRSAIGHVRYATSGDQRARDAQPLSLGGAKPLAVAHNGHLTNAGPLRRALQGGPNPFATGTDTEVILHLLAHQPGASLAERLQTVLSQVQGAYTLAVTDGRETVVARDPRGWRPLVLGRRRSPLGTAWLAASETVALQACDAEVVREIAPGEIATLGAQGQGESAPSPSRFVEPPADRRACVFEMVYFARPDSELFGRGVFATRHRMGEQLAAEQPPLHNGEICADVVVPIPDSGVAAALGYARRSGLPYEPGLMRAPEGGRTFIQPTQALRELGVRRKLHPVPELVAGARVVLVDDSLVRGTTSRQAIALLRQAGAREIHLRIAAPAVQWPCWYGIDTPSRDELLAARLSHAPGPAWQAVAAWLGADSLGYLSEEGLLQAAGPGGWCTACFTGRYPVPLVP
jgi:amidophosphoribosyltransferase